MTKGILFLTALIPILTLQYQGLASEKVIGDVLALLKNILILI